MQARERQTRNHSEGLDMKKTNANLMAVLALSVAALSACGGSGGSYTAAPPPDAVKSVAQIVADYFTSLFSSGNENSALVDASALTLAEDDTATPLPLP